MCGSKEWRTLPLAGSWFSLGIPVTSDFIRVSWIVNHLKQPTSTNHDLISYAAKTVTVEFVFLSEKLRMVGLGHDGMTFWKLVGECSRSLETESLSRFYNQ